MANSDPFEISKIQGASLMPFTRTIKFTEPASARGRFGAIQHGYRPKTWAMNGKRTSITTDGHKDTTRNIYGGGPTKAGVGVGVGAAGAGAGAVAAKKKVKKNMSDPFEISKKSYLRRPPFQNTRKENTKAGAVGAGSIYGVAGGALGAHVGAKQAKEGVRALKSVGAHPGKLRAAKLVTGHATKVGAISGAAAGAVGAGLGAVVGATSSPKGSKIGEYNRGAAIARQRHKAAKANRKAAEFAKSAFGVEDNRETVAKADRRMGGQAEWSGHLPKHTPGAVSANLAGKTAPSIPSKAAAIRAGLKPIKMAARVK